MKSILLSILVLLPFAASAQRDSLGIVARSATFGSAIDLSLADFHSASPAAMLYRSQYSLSQLSVTFDLRREQEALLQPLGDGALSGSFNAESYLRLNERSVTWADARYVRGNRRNVCWNSTADYLLLYPYIVGDSVGGDLSTEEYAFGGGYARRIGRFDVGIRGDFRAGQEYRQVDPRPRNIVSDFTLKLGAGIEFSQYVAGIDLCGQLYKQEQQVSFYDPRGANTSEMFMTGLGGYFARYSGMKDCTVAYDGKGYTLAAQLSPIQGKGWYARVAYDDLATERLYRPNNSIPVSRLRTQQLAASTAYRSGRWSLRAGVNYELREGTEMMADRNGQGRLVDEQTMYKNRTWQALTEATVKWQRSEVCYSLQPRLTWRRSAATYAYPARSMTLSQFCGAVRGRVDWHNSRWRVKAVAGIGYYISPNGKLSLRGIEERMVEYLSYTAARMSTNALAAEASLRAERKIGNKLAGFLDAAWNPRFYSGGLAEHCISVSCGILF